LSGGVPGAACSNVVTFTSKERPLDNSTAAA
jgi:hypothetical protein